MELIINSSHNSGETPGENDMETENTGTPHPDNNTLGEGDMDTGDNGAPPYPDDSTQQSSTPAQRNPEATTVSREVHTPSSTCGPSTTSSGASSLGSESRRKPLSPLTEFLTLPNIPPTPKSSKPKKIVEHVFSQVPMLLQ